ncbi:hypothetical protein Aph02nite_52090 [Actinoplanes philippinensis]|uniref:Trypsin n=1 Tax=Actinoplanes philippinensis TaxID=35752 RepID=A0A1I2IP87_9ACTN|nr:S1 family peptidase [Actinoplanes philippinensis]GIE79259.1 hypothetical protein Aph02nite_52090 [Actinoplanes philippinensis]SFF42646.1 Trypsin [Actinoplanes philippinensis]
MSSLRTLAGSALIGAVLLPLAAGSPAAAVAGPGATDTALSFAVKIEVGDTLRACSGALLNRWWVVTAKACFDDGAGVVAGRPVQRTTATIGRLDLTTSAGAVRTIDKVVPHPDRNVVLARLSQEAPGIAVAPVGQTAPAAGEQLVAAGFGRTADTWVPRQLHTGQFTVDEVTGATFQVSGTGGAAVCRGDAGGPILRSVGGGYELVGLHHSATGAGCLAETATENRAVETRLDDITAWLTANTLVPNALQVSVTDTRVGVLRGDYGTQVKEGGLSTLWTQLLTDARQIEVADDRIGVLTRGGVAYAKEGATTAAFVNEYSGVQQMAVSGNRVGVLTDAGEALAKEGGLSTAWVPQYSDVKQIEVTDTRVGVLTRSGVLLVKEGTLRTNWIQQYTGVKQFALFGDRIGVVTESGAAMVKAGGLGAAWVPQLATGAEAVVLRDDRVGVLTSERVALVKEGALTATFVTEHTDVRHLDVSGDRVGVVRYDGEALVKSGGLSTLWTTVW